MPGCLDTVITNHLDNRLLPGMSYCGGGCKGQSTCSRGCQSSLFSLTFTREGERDQERLLNLCSETLLHPLGDTA